MEMKIVYKQLRENSLRDMNWTSKVNKSWLSCCMWRSRICWLRYLKMRKVRIILNDNSECFHDKFVLFYLMKDFNSSSYNKRKKMYKGGHTEEPSIIHKSFSSCALNETVTQGF